MLKKILHSSWHDQSEISSYVYICVRIFWGVHVLYVPIDVIEQIVNFILLSTLLSFEEDDL